MDSGLDRVKDGDKMYHIAVCDDNQEEAHLIGRMTQEIMAQREIEAQVDLFFDRKACWTSCSRRRSNTTFFCWIS